VAWLLALGRARCKDDKAAVRKVGLQMVEGMLRLHGVLAEQQQRQGRQPQASGAGPSADDLQVLEDAAVDPMVSASTWLQPYAQVAVHGTGHATRPGPAGRPASAVWPLVAASPPASAGACAPGYVCKRLGPSASHGRLWPLPVPAQVSVRKAAVQAVCGLVEHFCDHASVAQLFARCALPMVRDPEAAIQELLLDRIQVCVRECMLPLPR
jgi:hypothetical protein